IAIAGETAIQGTDQIRSVIALGNKGQVPSYKVLNRDKGWVKIDDMLMPMAENEVKATQDEIHEVWVRSLVPLKGNSAYTFSPLGDAMVEDAPALGIRVSCEGHKDVNLYFDKGTFLLLKSEMRVKDNDGKEVNREFINSHFKEIGGLKEPTRFVIKKDGRLFMEIEVEDISRVEKLDDSIFAKP